MAVAETIFFWLAWAVVGITWFGALDRRRVEKSGATWKALIIVAAGPVAWAAVLAVLVGWMSS